MNFEGVVFPGQGTQFLGMGKDFIEFDEAKKIFDLAKDILKFDIYSVCQNDNDKLNSTEYTQPCILTLEIAMFNVISKKFNLNPIFFAGHSLGEYAALVASKVIPFEIAILIVNLRAKLMQYAANNSRLQSGMVAIIANPLPIEKIQEIALTHAVDLANDNSNQQVVLSGYNQDLEITVKKIEKLLHGSVRCVPLTVSAAFHSRYMNEIENEFSDYIKQFKNQIDCSKLINVISNYFGGFYPNYEIDTLITGLTKQISGSVKWRENMQHLLKQTQNILELGPGAPLRGFFKSNGITITSITNVRSMNKVFEYDLHT